MAFSGVMEIHSVPLGAVGGYSIHIVKALDYIYDHLHTRITLEDRSEERRVGKEC